MAFADKFPELMTRPTPLMRRFAQWLGDESGVPIESLARRSQVLTRQHFGRTMRIFAPLYVSN